MKRCHGRGDTPVVDDDGLPQTVSCENSFRRGTLQTIPAIQQQAMPDLYRRLPRLVQERTTWSHQPDLAYPRTLRVTIRCALAASDHSSSSSFQHGKQRRSVTSSKQTPVDGRRLIHASLAEQSELLQQWVAPILLSLLSGFGTSLNVTRINIALANFQDSGTRPSGEKTSQPVPSHDAGQSIWLQSLDGRSQKQTITTTRAAEPE